MSSLFDQNTPKENSEELLYTAIERELKPILEEWDKKCGDVQDGNLSGYHFTLMDPNRLKLIQDTSKLVLQFIWKKLGMKIPDYTRNVIDNDCEILDFKQNNK